MKRSSVIILVLVFVLMGNLIFAMPCFAQDPLKKLGRGIANVSLGWLTLFTTIEETGKSEGIYTAATYGVLKGVAKAIQRTFVGAYETVTFWLPKPDDFKPILTNPEFPLGKAEKE